MQTGSEPHGYPVGQTWLFDIGEARIEHRFEGPGVLHYRVLTGPRAGDEDTVQLHVEAVGPGLFITSWREHDGIVVIHVEDFTRGVFHSHVVRAGGQLVRFTGHMRQLTD